MKPKTFFVSLILSLLLAGLVTPTAAQGVSWTADYFNNTSLSGAPVFTVVETTPTHDWGAGSPSPAIPTDYFSVRWTSVQTMTAGNYQLTVRADDGVRVIVDGIYILNEWHPAPGSSYNLTFGVVAGAHTVVVEYYEATGHAYLNYSLTPVNSPPPSSTATATINTPNLNVRDAPNPYSGTVLLRVRGGETYPLVGRNADNSWVQLNVNGVIGWVNATYVTAVNVQSVPITDSGTRPTGATINATVTANVLNVRVIPDPVNGAVLARIRLGQIYPAIGRNGDNSWVQLNVNGVIGWVNRAYVYVPNLQNVPLVGTQPVLVVATVTTPQLNVRAIPDPINGLVITQVRLGQTYPVVGRNAASTWIQINANNLVGWVNAQYVTAANLQNVPVTG